MTSSEPGAGRDGARGGRRSERDVRRRVFSQNYLRDGGAAQRFLTLVDVDPGQLCLEIGAGDGALTKHLSVMCDRLIAYEIDEAVAARLAASVARRPNIEVIVGDFTKSTPPDEPFQAVGNIPFGVTSAIVDWCLAAPMLTSATMITQLEYAKKRTGGFGRWSLVTILSWPEYSWQLLGTIRREEFRPIPRVDAGVLRIERRAQPFGPPALLEAYRRMVAIGFEGVGGSLHASLSRVYPRDRVTAAFRRVDLPHDTVVAFIRPDEWWEIFSSLGARTPTTPARRSAPSRSPAPESPQRSQRRFDSPGR